MPSRVRSIFWPDAVLVPDRQLAGGNESLQALRLGAAHGLFCVGCCWSLMLLMFLVGAGSLRGMLVLGLMMALEKNFAWGRRLSTPLGVLLLVAGRSGGGDASLTLSRPRCAEGRP